MIIRVFKLTEASAKYLGNLPREDAVLVVKSEHKVRQMFIDVLEQAVYERADTKPAFDAIGAYFKGMMPGDAAFGVKVDSELENLRHYIDEGLVYRPAFETIRDYTAPSGPIGSRRWSASAPARPLRACTSSPAAMGTLPRASRSAWVAAVRI